MSWVTIEGVGVIRRGWSDQEGSYIIYPYQPEDLVHAKVIRKVLRRVLLSRVILRYNVGY